MTKKKNKEHFIYYWLPTLEGGIIDGIKGWWWNIIVLLFLFLVFKFIWRRLFLVAAAVWKVLGAHNCENWLSAIAFLIFSCELVFRLWRIINHWHHVKLFILNITVKLILFFSLLLLPDFCVLFQMLHYHLTISLFNLISLLGFFILLIPSPFIYLGFSESTSNAHSLTSFFAPSWIFLVFLH